MTEERFDVAPGAVHLTQAGLAARWHMSPRSLERWRRERYGPPWLRLGGVIRYRLEDVLAYERAHLSATS